MHNLQFDPKIKMDMNKPWYMNCFSTTQLKGDTT